MDKNRWFEIKGIFAQVVDLPPESRYRVLNELCPDAEIFEEVSGLLGSHEKEYEEMEPGLFDIAMHALAKRHSSISEAHPDWIGPYRILELLGRGGMGSVYVAEETEPMVRRVALKLIHLDLNHDVFVKRFKAEHQALAMMNHINIAHVYRAGTTGVGRPYFTMEYVPGKTITGYSEDKRLGIDERLRLFLMVCEGVKHAHRKGIIHCDLKPSNILVTIQNQLPVPKIIDFGIARIIDQSMITDKHKTLVSMVIGTPAYMSPEQADNKAVDTASDVYALGMLLYELLVGKLPFDDQVYQKTSISKILKVIKEDLPPLPSKRLRQLKELTKLPDSIQTHSFPQVLRRLEGDLDLIIMKAVSKDPAMRYGSVSEFSDDIQRYLEDKPVRARPPSRIYLVRKYIQRHRHGVVAAAFGLLSLIGLVAGLSYTLYKTKQAKRVAEASELRAQEEAKRASDIADLMKALLDIENMPYGMSPEAVLSHGEEILQNQYDTSNRSLITLRATMAERYYRQTEYAKARTHLELVTQFMNRQEPPESLERMLSNYFLARVYFKLGQLQDAEAILQDLIPQQTAILGPNHVRTLWSRSLLGDVLRRYRRYDESEAIYLEVLNQQEQGLGPNSDYRRSTLHSYILQLIAQERFEEAEPLCREVVEKMLARPDPIDRSTVSHMYALARILYGRNKLEEARAWAMRAYELRRAMKGLLARETINVQALLIIVELRLGRDLEAVYERFTHLVHSAEAVLGQGDDVTLLLFNNMSDWLLNAGRLEEAEALKRRELALRYRFSDMGDLQATRLSEITLLEICLARQKFKDAEVLEETLLPGLEQLFGKHNRYVLYTRGLSAYRKFKERPQPEAITQLNEAIDKLRHRSLKDRLIALRSELGNVPLDLRKEGN